MRLQEEPETRQRLAVFGGDFGQVMIELVKGIRKHLKLITYSPKDLRYKMNSVELSFKDLNDLKLFLETMLQRTDELIETIPVNKLAEGETIINDIYIHYMVRRNRVDTRLTLARETGVGVGLQFSEVREFHNILEEVIARW